MNFQTGAGYVIFDYVLMALLLMAALLNFAVLRDRYIESTKPLSISRRLIAAGFAVLAVRYGMLIYERGDLPLSMPSLIGHYLLAVGSSLGCISKIRSRWAFDFAPESGERRLGIERRHQVSPVSYNRRKGERRAPCEVSNVPYGDNI